MIKECAPINDTSVKELQSGIEIPILSQLGKVFMCFIVQMDDSYYRHAKPDGQCKSITTISEDLRATGVSCVMLIVVRRRFTVEQIST